jgi:hypothetical protein
MHVVTTNQSLGWLLGRPGCFPFPRRHFLKHVMTSYCLVGHWNFKPLGPVLHHGFAVCCLLAWPGSIPGLAVREAQLLFIPRKALLRHVMTSYSLVGHWASKALGPVLQSWVCCEPRRLSSGSPFACKADCWAHNRLVIAFRQARHHSDAEALASKDHTADRIILGHLPS